MVISWNSFVHLYFQIPDFLADAGGQMGMFLGASFLSLVEFLEWLLDWLMEIGAKLLLKKLKNPGHKTVTVLPV